MASSADWKSSISAIDRYEIIQKIQESLHTSSMSEAIAIEQAAYQISATREEYDLACQPNCPSPQPTSEIANEALSEETGVRIGSYLNCRPIADGVTSQVYRSGDHALKVIVAFQNMEPHNPQREVKILKTLRQPCIPLTEVFRDQEQQLVLVFPFMPYTLADLLDKGPISKDQIRSIFTDALMALKDIHAQGIIHRDIKPSAMLLSSPTGPAFLSDFGTAWHPEFSVHSEPASDKILDIGTGPYRAPEVLFGDKAYGPAVDMWGLGVTLSEAIQDPPRPVFESRPVHEDGNQLGLILSIFKTLGTPTPETWPEAKGFRISPFELWTVFPQQPWDAILPNVDPNFKDLVASLVRYDGARATADQESPASTHDASPSSPFVPRRSERLAMVAKAKPIQHLQEDIDHHTNAVMAIEGEGFFEKGFGRYRDGIVKVVWKPREDWDTLYRRVRCMEGVVKASEGEDTEKHLHLNSLYHMSEHLWELEEELQEKANAWEIEFAPY
ncbi:Fc.00g079960.m01.CDS01 [Cosmosporella sp. VM-42]